MAKNTKVMRCTCKHEYQDRKYGKGKRVHNMKVDGKFVCTVCRREKGI